MGLQRFLLVGLTAGVIGAAGAAHAAYRITGMDLYGHGFVTASDPGWPPIGAHEYIHVSLTLFPPYPGNPYAPMPVDATGTFHFLTNSGPLDGFNVTIYDSFNFYTPCEYCAADFSLVNGELSGPFFFQAGLYPVGFTSVGDASFYGDSWEDSESFRTFRGSFAANRIVIHTDAPTPVPEPASWALMLSGFLVAGQALRLMARRSLAGTRGRNLRALKMHRP